MLAGGERLASGHIVLAVGHSARDTFQMLLERGVHIEPKPFSIGFRIEHPQSLIDRARFGPQVGNEILGAADYKPVKVVSACAIELNRTPLIAAATVVAACRCFCMVI